MSIISLNADLLRICHGFTSTEQHRGYLNGVHVESNPHGEGVIMVATDGYRLMCIHDEHGFISSPNLEGSIIKLTKDMLKECKTKPRGEVGRKALIESGGMEITVYRVGDDDGYVKHKSYTTPMFISGTFPDWRRVLPNLDQEPSEMNKDGFSFNSDNIKSFCEAAKELEKLIGNSQGYLRVVPCGDGPALIRFPYSPNAFGLSMPGVKRIEGLLGLPDFMSPTSDKQSAAE